jgi:hypothetical protein
MKSKIYIQSRELESVIGRIPHLLEGKLPLKAAHLMKIN